MNIIVNAELQASVDPLRPVEHAALATENARLRGQLARNG
jgi:hypothetical protein